MNPGGHALLRRVSELRVAQEALAAEARATADALRAERLATARSGRGAKGASKAGGSGARSKPSCTAKAKRPRKIPASQKARASTKAKGKRRQAKRDSR